MSNLHHKITEEEEEEFHMRSMDFYRPPLKQIGNSIYEIRTHFISNGHNKGHIKVVPTECSSQLVTIRDTLIKHLEGDSFLYKFNIVTKALNHTADSEQCLPSLVVLMDSLALAMDFEILPKPTEVECDVFLAICGQPVIVLTLVDEDKDSETVTGYNISVGTGVTSALYRFMDENVNIVCGVLFLKEIEEMDTFKCAIETIANRSSMFVTTSSFSTNPSKYEKIVTAFWAGVAETRSIISRDGRVTTDYLRFLTKDQCIILLENINKKKVEVQFQRGTGATTLMVEVARRLAKLAKTLLVCRSEEERDRLSSVYPHIKTPTDLDRNDLSKYTNIVDETGAVRGSVHGKLWRFVKYTEYLQRSVNILEKQNANIEKLINLLPSRDRQDKFAHLSQELETLKLIDISSQKLLSVFDVPINLALEFILAKHRPSGTTERCRGWRLETEEYMYLVLAQLKLGIQGRKDLFVVLGDMIKKVKSIIPSLQAKVHYLQQATEGRAVTEEKKIKVDNDAQDMEPHKPSQEIDGEHKTSQPIPGVPDMEHNERSVETDGKHVTVSPPVPVVRSMEHNKIIEETDDQHKTLSAQFLVQLQGHSDSSEVSDSEEIGELKKKIKTLEKVADRKQQQLNELRKDYGVEWEYIMDSLSEEMPALKIYSVITDVIGTDEIPIIAAKETKLTASHDRDVNSHTQRRGIRRCHVHQLRHLQYGTLKHREILDVVREMLVEDSDGLVCLQAQSNKLELVYGGKLYIIGEIESERSGPVSCPAMTLHKDRVYDSLDVSEDGHELTNMRESGIGHHSGQFKMYWGTCSGLIPLPSFPTTLTVPTYWETNTRVQVRGEARWWPLLEMGVMEESQVDRDIWVFSRTRGWCVCVVCCYKHHGYCTQVWGEGRQRGVCLTDTMPLTPGTDVMLKYAVVVDIGRGRLAFIDLNRQRVLYMFDVVLRDSLRPMFSVLPYWFGNVAVTMRLVSGSTVVMDDKKQKLIAKAWFGRV